MDNLWAICGYIWDNNPKLLVSYPTKNLICNKNGTTKGLTGDYWNYSVGLPTRNHLDER